LEKLEIQAPKVVDFDEPPRKNFLDQSWKAPTTQKFQEPFTP
jgi:hypothetical protein